MMLKRFEKKIDKYWIKYKDKIHRDYHSENCIDSMREQLKFMRLFIIIGISTISIDMIYTLLGITIGLPSLYIGTIVFSLLSMFMAMIIYLYYEKFLSYEDKFLDRVMTEQEKQQLSRKKKIIKLL